MAPWILSPFIECAPSQTSDFLRRIRAHLPSLGENNLDCVQRQNVPAWVVAVMVKDKQSGKVAINCLSRWKERVFVGTGTTVRQGDNDSVRWMSGEFMRRRARNAKLIVEALVVQKSESGGELI